MNRYLAALLGFLVVVPPLAIMAQGQSDLRGLAVNWVRGRYASPLLCEIDGQPVRGLRRVLVTASPGHSRVPTGRLTFVEMEVDDASRCFTDLGGAAPNLRGSLHFRLQGPPHPDSAARDLKAMLKRQNGITFDVVRGDIQRQSVGEDSPVSERIDYTGGRLQFARVAKGSDADRLLKDFPSPRKLQMTLSQPGGTALSLPLFLVELR